VLLEMQAAGIPVVSTRHADIPSVVPDPERLSAEEDVDAIADQLVAVSELSEADWQAHTQRARDFVEHRHDAAVVAKEVEAVYREAIT
jgi:colanic acid/amylovoran biosynthesis glycosyltransferase